MKEGQDTKKGGLEIVRMRKKEGKEAKGEKVTRNNMKNWNEPNENEGLLVICFLA